MQPHVILDRPQKAAGAQTIKIMGQHAENGEKQLTAASHKAHQQTITQHQLRCEKLQANLTAARDKARRDGCLERRCQGRVTPGCLGHQL